jgi:hypothetical protein
MAQHRTFIIIAQFSLLLSMTNSFILRIKIVDNLFHYNPSILPILSIYHYILFSHKFNSFSIHSLYHSLLFQFKNCLHMAWTRYNNLAVFASKYLLFINHELNTFHIWIRFLWLNCLIKSFCLLVFWEFKKLIIF